MQRIIVLALCCCLCACAVDQVRRSGDRQAITSQNRGFAMFSFGPAKARDYATHYNVLLRAKSDGSAISVLYTKDGILAAPTKPDFSNDRSEGAIYLVELPAGDYEIHRFRLFIPNYINLFSPDMLAPFSISPGSITYLGRLTVSHTGRARDEMRLYANRSDAFQEDLALARNKYPEVLSTMRMVNQTH